MLYNLYVAMNVMLVLPIILMEVVGIKGVFLMSGDSYDTHPRSKC